MVTLVGYEITEQIYSGSRTLVYRGIREKDRKQVVIKLLRQEYPTFNDIVQFRNQYTIAKNLDIDGVVKPYSLEPYKNGYALVMEDFGGISLKEYIASHFLSLLDFLEIALQIVASLEGLYRNRVIHKDIKPANILIHPNDKRVKIIDFSNSSLLPKETQVPTSPNLLEGTLAYLSPEQTGRMNRLIDWRSDFYSLGATFFELLTGQLPFESDDPIELVYCHIAKQPPQVHSINLDIPPIISKIISKLMAKNAEDRYQSALGLKYDLEVCWQALKTTGNIETFALGQRDICDRFQIPDKLYGRQVEVETLLAAFERVARGNTEMMLVAGFSGIGKTAVINEIHKPIVRQRGYFIKGKYEQFQRNIPFLAFVQAFRDLMGQLLSESDTQLHIWKTQILEVLGENAQAIVDVIPELEKIIGKQPPAPELSGSAVQNRFNLLFEKFIHVFTTPEHPLVMFLDDLQWADLASLKLIQLLVSEVESQYLLLIGAYRDNEVSAVHPLMLTLDEICQTEAKISTIALEPLNSSDLNYLVADTLNCSPKVAFPLTALVLQKTKGNPFFATQFLKLLYDDDLINFNFNLGYWQCDIAQVKALSLTDNVVEFMAMQLQKLPPTTQEALKLAACIGNQFNLATLSVVYETSQTETATHLWRALLESFIIPQSEIYKFFQDESKLKTQGSLSSEVWNLETEILTVNYKFLHDRVQQAAYSLIPEERKQSTHLKIGRLLLIHTSQEKLEETIFIIVNQLNLGIELIKNQVERDELARLNLLAGQKAKASTAYAAAIKYLAIGREVLAADSWESHYKLTLALYETAAEAAYLGGDFEQAERLIEIVLKESKTLLEKIETYEIKIQMYAAQNQMEKALNTGLEVLDMLGVPLIQNPPPNLIIQELYNLPEMTDLYKLAAMRILTQIQPPAYHANPAILPFVAFTMVHLSVNNGNSPPASFGYAFYGLVLCIMGDYESGYQFGQLALRILNKFDTQDFKSKVYNLFNCFIRHWKENACETIELFREIIRIALETGDLEYASYASFNYCHNIFLTGNSLDYVDRQVEQYIVLLRKIKQEFQLQATQIWGQLVLNLMDEALETQQINGERFDEKTILSNPQQTNSMSLYSLYFAKTLVTYLFGDYTAASENASMAEKYEQAMSVLFPVTQNPFYYSLALLAQCSPLESTDCSQARQKTKENLKKVAINQEKMKVWAENAPMNFQHKYDLVEAEKSRVLEQHWQAVELYDRAITGAQENKYIHEEAIANELAAKFYLNLGKEKIAKTYMLDAYYAYSRWGAKAKVEDLEKHYAKLLNPILQREKIRLNSIETIANTISNSLSNSSSQNTLTSNSTNISDVLDLASVIKASQALSSEMQLEKLLFTLIQVVMKSAGSEKFVLILLHKDRWVIEAIQKFPQSPIIMQSIPFESSPDVPANLINYVKNTIQTLVIGDPKTQTLLASDPYLIDNQPQSLLCTPILNQGKLIGILYLENSFTRGVFTSDRIQVINLLCSQVAISLENARLYQQSQEHAQQLERSLNDLKQIQLQLVQSEKMSALGNLVAGIAHEINNPVGFIAGNIQPAVDYIKDVFGLLDLYQKKFPNPGYEIEEEMETIDLKYVRQDLQNLLSSMTQGVQRIRDISQSLRTFSRADTEHKTLFNIHEGIDSAILILKHRLKASETYPAIEVIKDYGNLPPVRCFPGQLNQVFMNLLANAIDAIEESLVIKNQLCADSGALQREVANRVFPLERTETDPLLVADKQPMTHGKGQKISPQIRITTRLTEDRKSIVIWIQDNGLGMTKEVQEKIFEHLFTTKPVGKGTGLGLSIVQQIIVEKHGGTISINSTWGEGAEFRIEIPALYV
ncbi:MULTISPECIES: trifunctional serine/threonine-protein kinase/ATP-binding protein/sensor histidine kinase [Nostocales]|nr:ATP-binding sensor histidine kinase [Tolypothrix bouteillei]KAF3888011.1 AAA family ATPase [Tolypothrix bouteillei VB521301]